MNQHPITEQALHAAEPAIEEKWVSQVWIRQVRSFVWMCGCICMYVYVCICMCVSMSRALRVNSTDLM